MPEVKKISERFGVEVEDRLAEDQVDEVIDRVKEEVTEEHEEKPREQ
jgi:hypothetical protein